MWLLSKLRFWTAEPPPRLLSRHAVWRDGVARLQVRTRHGSRESGAFLLGTESESTRRIEQFVYYDDIDPNALSSGIVHFSGSNYSKLWEICRQTGLTVVADVHVHPGGYGQSSSDRNEPAMPRAGHIALILPNFAKKEVDPGGIGIYEYLGNQKWVDCSRDGVKFFRLD